MGRLVTVTPKDRGLLVRIQHRRRMKLSQLRKQGTQRQETYPGDQEPGTIRNAVAYPTPIAALYQGRPVNLIATGDIAGMSPAEKFVDEDGRLDWAPSEDFTVTGHAAPHSAEQQGRLLRGLQS